MTPLFFDDPDDPVYDNYGAAECARAAGWRETPEGWWWRDIVDGETIVNGDRVGYFLGSGPYLFADDAEDACVADDLDCTP